MSSTLARIRQQRLEKVERLRKMGINPYPARSNRSNTNQEIVRSFKKYSGKKVTVVGRVMSIREHGSLRFIGLQDYSGAIQLIIRKDALSALDKKRQVFGWKELKLIDVGDFVQAEGIVLKSKTDEISVEVSELKLLTKAIRPLPEKWEGIKDKETMFRRRYLDLVMNPKRKDMFTRKSHFWDVNREFMHKHGFIELETPILEHVTGGADASPFITHHNALDQDFYLRISTELYLKRLVGGGYEKIYTLGPNFRNEGIDDEHLQEYNQIEWYWAYADFRDNMELVKEMFRYIAKKVYGKTIFTRGKKTFDLSKPWEEIDYVKIIKERFGIDIFKSSQDAMVKILRENSIVLDKGSINRIRLTDNLWKIIRKDISGPAFLINEPKFVSPLAKSSPDDEKITERFHIILGGSELGNGYTELNDPIDQFDRFKEQQAARDEGDDEAQMMDIDYVEMLEYGMPPTSGYAHSERLFWFLENVTAREGTLFPQTRYYLDENTKEIYGIDQPIKVNSLVTNKFTKKISSIRGHIISSKFDKIDPKYVKIDKKLAKKYYNINLGVAIIKGISVKKEKELLEMLKKKVINGIKNNLSAQEIDDIPQIESYFRMYVEMGVDTRSRKSSPEALLRRIVDGKNLYNVNTCVDAYNLAVVLTQISSGAFDLAKVKLPVVLREARKGESIEIIGSEEKKLKPGEVCYFDKKGPYNMDFNYRDAERTKVTEDTRDIVINIDGVYDITKEQIADALKLNVELITQFCGGTVELMGILSA